MAGPTICARPTHPEVRQFIGGEPDGPVRFHYPAPPLAEDLGTCSAPGRSQALMTAVRRVVQHGLGRLSLDWLRALGHSAFFLVDLLRFSSGGAAPLPRW